MGDQVWAVMMVRDEEDILPYTLAHLLTQVDHVLVADNRSVDNTRKILEGFDRVTVLDDPDPRYLQSEKMTNLAHMAAAEGAQWILPVDADEWPAIYRGSSSSRIADLLLNQDPRWLVVSLDLYDHRATGLDTTHEDPTVRMGWRTKQMAPLPKVAVRYQPDLVIHQGNHGASYNGGVTTMRGLLITHHFPYRSAEQFIRKARNGAEAYAAAGGQLAEDVGAHWRGYGRILQTEGEEALADVFRTWFWVADPRLRKDMIYEPVAHG